MSWFSSALSGITGGASDKVGDAINKSGLEGWINQALAGAGDVGGALVGLPGAGHAAMALGGGLGDPFGGGGSSTSSGVPDWIGSVGAQGIPFANGGSSVDLSHLAGMIQSDPSMLDKLGDSAKSALQSAFGNSSGGWDWGKIASAAAGAATAYNGQANANSANGLAQFNANTSRNAQVNSNADQLSKTMLGVQSNMQAAPLKDRASAMLAARIGAPAPSFQPRDFTQQGFGPGLRQGPQGGAAAVQGTMNAANAAYTPGQGGYGDTSLQQAILKRLGGLAGVDVPGAPSATPKPAASVPAPAMPAAAPAPSFGTPAMSRSPLDDPNDPSGMGRSAQRFNAFY